MVKLLESILAGVLVLGLSACQIRAERPDPITGFVNLQGTKTLVRELEVVDTKRHYLPCDAGIYEVRGVLRVEYADVNDNGYFDKGIDVISNPQARHIFEVTPYSFTLQERK